MSVQSDTDTRMRGTGSVCFFEDSGVDFFEDSGVDHP